MTAEDAIGTHMAAQETEELLWVDLMEDRVDRVDLAEDLTEADLADLWDREVREVLWDREDRITDRRTAEAVCRDAFASLRYPLG